MREHSYLAHLYEKDCSIQRRHQQIIKESPAPIVTEGLRCQVKVNIRV
jgi:acetyl/propionyl-CoA carboxylase alpha subunit